MISRSKLIIVLSSIALLVTAGVLMYFYREQLATFIERSAVETSKSSLKDQVIKSQATLENIRQTLKTNNSTSLAKINQAYKENKIDEKRTIFLSLQAIFASNKLPAEFQNAKFILNNAFIETLFYQIESIANNYKSYSSEEQAQIEKYLAELSAIEIEKDKNSAIIPYPPIVRPIEEFLDPPKESTHFSVHYMNPADGESNGKIDQMLRELEDGLVADTTKYGFKTFDWTDTVCYGSQTPNNPNEKIDIYLMPHPFGDADAIPVACPWSWDSGWVIMKDSFDIPKSLMLARHELFHVLQYSYPTGTWAWSRESTASYAGYKLITNELDYPSGTPANQAEEDMVFHMTNHQAFPELPLDFPPKVNLTSNELVYANWPFWLFLEETYDEKFVSEVMNNLFSIEKATLLDLANILGGREAFTQILKDYMAYNLFTKEWRAFSNKGYIEGANYPAIYFENTWFDHALYPIEITLENISEAAQKVVLFAGFDKPDGSRETTLKLTTTTTMGNEVLPRYSICAVSTCTAPQDVPVDPENTGQRLVEIPIESDTQAVLFEAIATTTKESQNSLNYRAEFVPECPTALVEGECPPTDPNVPGGECSDPTFVGKCYYQISNNVNLYHFSSTYADCTLDRIKQEGPASTCNEPYCTITEKGWEDGVLGICLTEHVTTCTDNYPTGGSNCNYYNNTTYGQGVSDYTTCEYNYQRYLTTRGLTEYNCKEPPFPQCNPADTCVTQCVTKTFTYDNIDVGKGNVSRADGQAAGSCFTGSIPDNTTECTEDRFPKLLDNCTVSYQAYPQYLPCYVSTPWAKTRTLPDSPHCDE